MITAMRVSAFGIHHSAESRLDNEKLSHTPVPEEKEMTPESDP